MFDDNDCFYDILTGKNGYIYSTNDNLRSQIMNLSLQIIKKYKSLIDPIKDEFLILQKQIPQERILDFKDIFMSVYTPLNDFYNYIDKNKYSAKESILQRFYVVIYESFKKFKQMFGERKQNDTQEKTQSGIVVNNKLRDLMKRLNINIDDVNYKIQDTNCEIFCKPDPKDEEEEEIESPDDIEMNISDIQDIKQKNTENQEKDEWFNKSSFNYSISNNIGKLEIQINKENTLYKFIYCFNYDNAFYEYIKKDYQVINNYFENFKLPSIWNTCELYFVQRIENEYSQFTQAFNYLRFMMTNEQDFIKFVDNKPKKIKSGIIEVQRFINNMKEFYSDVHDFKEIFKKVFINYLKHEFVEKDSLDHLLIYYPLDNIKKIYYEPEIWKIENFEI